MIRKIITFTLIMGAIVLMLAWSEKHDKEILQAAEKYEACVKQEYGVSPAYWYAEHGEYPTCAAQ